MNIFLDLLFLLLHFCVLMEAKLETLIDSMKNYNSGPRYPTRRNMNSSKKDTVSPKDAPTAEVSDGDIMGALSLICSKLDALSNRFECLEKKLEEKDKEINVLGGTIEKQSNYIESLHIRLDKIEQSTLSDQIILSGSPIGKVVNSKNRDGFDVSIEEVKLVINKEFDTEMTVEDIKRTVQLKGRRDAVVVTLRDKNLKYNLFSKLKTMKKDTNDGPIIFVSDFLTSHRSKILYGMRLLRKSTPNPWFKIATRNGTPFAIIDGVKKWMPIICKEDLKTLSGCRQC